MRARCAVVLSLAALSFAAPHGWSQSEDPDAVRERLETLKRDIREITDRLEARRAERDREQDALAEAEKALGQIELALRETRERLSAARERERELAQSARLLSDQIGERRETLAEQLRIAYRTGLRSRIKALLNQEDPARIGRVLALHGYLGRARAEVIHDLDQRLESLAKVQEQQRIVARDLAALARRQDQERERRRELLSSRAEALVRIEATIRDATDRLVAMRESAERLEALLEDLSTALADIPPEAEIQPFAELRGALPMPARAAVRAAFQEARNGQVDWEGWLIDAEVGDPVRAVAYGRVAYADWLRGYGMMVIIDHGDGYMTLYGQNRSLVAEVGDWVAPGEVIALAGDSGGGSQPGLYFQIRHEGRPVDPAGWVQR